MQILPGPTNVGVAAPFLEQYYLKNGQALSRYQCYALRQGRDAGFDPGSHIFEMAIPAIFADVVTFDSRD